MGTCKISVGGSNMYPQSVFSNKKVYTLVDPSFTVYIKVGYKGVYIS